MPEMLGLKYLLYGWYGCWIRDCGTNADPHPSRAMVDAAAADIAPYIIPSFGPSAMQPY